MSTEATIKEVAAWNGYAGENETKVSYEKRLNSCSGAAPYAMVRAFHTAWRAGYNRGYDDGCYVPH